MSGRPQELLTKEREVDKGLWYDCLIAGRLIGPPQSSFFSCNVHHSLTMPMTT